MAARTAWKALLGNWLNWDKPPNPYDHLPRMLTAEQLDEVMCLPRKSEQQVDRIIAFLDNGACDDELRQGAYELFRRAPDYSRKKRSEERRGGKEWGSTFRFWWSPCQ